MVTGDIVGTVRILRGGGQWLLLVNWTYCRLSSVDEHKFCRNSNGLLNEVLVHHI